MTTNVYDAKDALFTKLIEEMDPGRLLVGAQVSYEWPGANAELDCIYGGGVRFVQDDGVAEQWVLKQEEAKVSVYIRVVKRPPVDVRVTDQACSAWAKKVAQVLKKNQHLTFGFIAAGITEGQGDYSKTDDETVSILALQVKILSAFNFD